MPPTLLLHTCLSAVALYVSPLLAQTQTIVSPQPASATVEGSSSNLFPFVTSTLNRLCRYMQVHSDIGGAPRVIRRIAFRRDGSAAVQPSGTRAVDMELRIGHSVPWNAISYVFARNWIGPPSLALPRQVLNIGPLASPGYPAPFEMVVPLGSPFAYTGQSALAFEIVQYSNFDNGLTSAHDLEGGTATTGMPQAVTGNGCTATGQTSMMGIGIEHVDRGGAYQFGAFVKLAPANAPTVVFFGASNPNLTVPGLCGNLHTDLLSSVYVGSADASGYIGEPRTFPFLDHPSALCTFVLPNTFGGATIYAQAHALDASRSDAIKICNSIGSSFVVPLPNTTVIARASRIYNFQPQVPAYPHAMPLLGGLGYAAVTEFTY